MEREPAAAAIPPNPHAPPPGPTAGSDRLWLPLALLTVAFVAFAVGVFVRSGLPFPWPGAPAPLRGTDGQSSPNTVSPVNLAALAPDLSDWQQSPGCAFDGTVFTARAASSGPTVCLAPAGDLTTVDVSIAVQLVVSDPEQLAGLVLGETDPDHFYTLGVTKFVGVELGQWSATAGTWQYRQLASGPSDDSPDGAGWLHLHLISSATSCFVTIQATVVPLALDDPYNTGGCAFTGRFGVYVAGPEQSAQFAQLSLSER